MTDNRALARNLFDVGVAAADPYCAVALLRCCAGAGRCANTFTDHRRWQGSHTHGTSCACDLFGALHHRDQL